MNSKDLLKLTEWDNPIRQNQKSDPDPEPASNVYIPSYVIAFGSAKYNEKTREVKCSLHQNQWTTGTPKPTFLWAANPSTRVGTITFIGTSQGITIHVEKTDVMPYKFLLREKVKFTRKMLIAYLRDEYLGKPLLYSDFTSKLLFECDRKEYLNQSSIPMTHRKVFLSQLHFDALDVWDRWSPALDIV